MALYCELHELITESDVEQKLIFPFLNSNVPMGLGIKEGNIFTKSALRGKAIGKGNDRKIYFPDYLISIQGIPLLVVEAKKPGEDLEKAFAEARLYATEINSQLKHGLNCCKYIIACNGEETWVGYTDQAEPVHQLLFDEYEMENPVFSQVLEFCSAKVLYNDVSNINKESRGDNIYKRPVSALGGKRVQDEELEENRFGRLFIFQNRKIFDPSTEEEKNIIVNNAYVKTSRREQHAEPIYKEIRKFMIPSAEHVTSISTESPVEMANSISMRINEHIDEYSLMLLVGNVGSGKSTFIRHFRAIYLKETNRHLSERCDWVFINMNDAPLSPNDIYPWIKERIISLLKSNHDDIDFDDLDIIKKIFRKEIAVFDKGIGRLYKGENYDRELASLLAKSIENENKYLSTLLDFLRNDYSIIPIIVLDNCDKRTREEQLLMFDVAQWLRSTFKCIVILPMRDSTFDLYRNEPPLDTVVKDLVFHIDPPDLLKVLQQRINYICRITKEESTSYDLTNDMHVSIKESELTDYFKAIMEAIRRNEIVRDIFYRLADRNIRNGIQIFEDFCKSGHIKSEEILGMRAAKEYDLPLYKFMNALLRRNRKYYHDKASNFVNLFSSDFHDTLPDPFVRVDILNWLKQKEPYMGPSNIKGMFKVKDLVQELQLVGHKEEVILRELIELLNRKLIISETLLPDVEMDDLLKITLAGKLHLSLLKNPSYLAACAEDVYFKDLSLVEDIHSRLISIPSSKLCVALNARDLLNYLEKYREDNYSTPLIYLENNQILSVFDLKESKEGLERFISGDSSIREKIDSHKKYKRGMEIECKTINKDKFGIIVLLEGAEGVKGFLSSLDAQYCLSVEDYETLKIGDWLKCSVIEYDYSHLSFQMKYIEKIEQMEPDETFNLL